VGRRIELRRGRLRCGEACGGRVRRLGAGRGRGVGQAEAGCAGQAKAGRGRVWGGQRQAEAGFGACRGEGRQASGPGGKPVPVTGPRRAAALQQARRL
jgi:hypothetical protein